MSAAFFSDTNFKLVCPQKAWVQFRARTFRFHFFFLRCPYFIFVLIVMLQKMCVRCLMVI